MTIAAPLLYIHSYDVYTTIDEIAPTFRIFILDVVAL